MTPDAGGARPPLTTAPARRLYYGWVIVGACNLVACITWGVAIFNQGVFAAYWITAYDWPPAALAGAPALFQLWAGFAGIFVGRVVDRHGPRPALLAGAAFVCLALVGYAHVSEIWHVYPAFLLMGTGFACIHTVTLGKIVARWFYRRRARAMAAATIGAGIGGAVLVPLNAWLIEGHGPAASCLALGVISVAALVPLALWVVKDGPETVGQQIDGDAPGAAGATATPKAPGKAGATAATGAPAAVDDHAARDVRVWTMAEAMRRISFWCLAFCLAFGMLAQSAFLFHQTPFLQESMGLIGAAKIVSLTTLAGIGGRAVFILVGDRLSTRLWTTLVYAFQALAFLTLAFAEGPTGLTVGSVMFGFTMGLVIVLQPLTVAYVFGRESFGRIYGAIYFAIRTGAAIGPLVIGAVLALAATYQTGWLIVGGSLAVAILILPLALKPTR